MKGIPAARGYGAKYGSNYKLVEVNTVFKGYEYEEQGRS